MFKKMLIISILLILSMGFVSASDNVSNDVIAVDSAVNVDKLEDTLTPSGGEFGDIQETVDHAKDGDVIELNGEYEGFGNEVYVGKSLTFKGVNDTVLDAKNEGESCFYIEGTEEYYEDFDESNKIDVTFQDLKFINAKHGIISTDGVRLSVINCTFINIKSKISDYEMGGAIQGDSVKIYNSSFINCTAKYGGAVSVYGAIINNCSFINCYGSYGGAIFGYNFTVANSKFIKNKAGINGGAIAVESSPAHITNCEFEENHAKGYGSVINAYCCDLGESGYQLLIENSTFSNNSADYSVMFNQNLFKYSEYENRTIFAYTSQDMKLKVSISNCSGSSNIAVPKISVILTPTKVSTTWGNVKSFNVKVVNAKTKEVMKNFPVNLKIYEKNPHDANYVTIYTNSKGIASYKTSRILALGSFKVDVTSGYIKHPASKKTSSIKISKASTIIKAPKVTAKYKKSKYFKVTVKNKASKKIVKSLKIKIKVYTGKKYKTYNVKTNKKGVAKINTNKLKRGTHKVVISSGNSNYKISAKSTIKIK